MLKHIFSNQMFNYLLIAMAFIFAIQSQSQAQSKSKKGWLGVGIQEMTPSMSKDYELGNRRGLLITSVVEKSPADDAGLREDDIILTFNGKSVELSEEFSRTVRKTERGTKVKLLIMRDGKEKQIELTIGKRKRRHSFVWSDDNNFQFFMGRPQLGVQVHDLNGDLAEYFKVNRDDGVLIIEVTEDSPAESAGLKAGDVITRIDDEKISSHEDLIETLEDYEDGDVTSVQFVRKGKTQKVEVELEGSDFHNLHFFGSGLHKGRRLHVPNPPRIEIAPKMRFEFKSRGKSI